MAYIIHTRTVRCTAKKNQKFNPGNQFLLPSKSIFEFVVVGHPGNSKSPSQILFCTGDTLANVPSMFKILDITVQQQCYEPNCTTATAQSPQCHVKFTNFTLCKVLGSVHIILVLLQETIVMQNQYYAMPCVLFVGQFCSRVHTFVCGQKGPLRCSVSRYQKS